MPSRTDVLPADLACTIAKAGVNISLPERQLEDAIRSAIAYRRGYIDGWHYDIAGWCVTLLHPDHELFRGTTLATALGWCLVWLMTREGEIGIEGFAS
jgi:hypothetical protein